MSKQTPPLIFTFEEAVVIRFCLQIFQQTDFSGVAPDSEVREAKNMARDIYNQLSKVEHSFTFSQLCVIGGALDNLQDLVAQGSKFEVSNEKLSGYLLLLPKIQSKIKKLLAN